MKKGGPIRAAKGASAVEFALVLPVLLLILFGIIEYGWVLTYQIVLTNAVSQGARAGVRAEDEAEAQGYAKQAVREAFWIQDLKEDAVETSISEDEEPKRIEVRVPGIHYKPLTGFLPSALIPEKIAAKAVMVFP
jgi:Flp pilus assembly protein TadG